jgi:hypothetical protein
MIATRAPSSWKEISDKEKENFNSKVRKLQEKEFPLVIPNAAFKRIARLVSAGKNEDKALESVVLGLGMRSAVDALEGTPDELPFLNIFSHQDAHLLFKDQDQGPKLREFLCFCKLCVKRREVFRPRQKKRRILARVFNSRPVAEPAFDPLHWRLPC